MFVVPTIFLWRNRERRGNGNAEEKDVFVDTVASVEAEKTFEENQRDKGKEVVDDDKVDDQSVKRRSLSRLFKEVLRYNRLFVSST